MKVHFCDICRSDLTGERMHILDLHYYNDEAMKMPSVPLMELCPACRVWLKQVIDERRSEVELQLTNKEE